LKKLLFIDDQVEEWIGILNDYLSPLDFMVIGEADPDKALSAIKKHSPDAVMLDLMFGSENLGKAALEKIKKKYPFRPPVMIITTTMDKAEYNANDYSAADDRCFKDLLRGKDDFVDLSNKLNVMIANAETGDKDKQSERNSIKDFGFIVGNSPKMRETCEIVSKIADTDITALITGESGTGKEMIARAILKKSRRADKPFVAINCGAIPDNLLESELFGYEKGAFTGAITPKPGKFELANGGTIFLDEVSELSLNLQVKLLRALQEKEIERVGGTRPIPVDIRVIAATNKNIDEEVREGKFREDLYYRLNTVIIHIPPLRERSDDFRILYEYFVKKHSNILRKNISLKMRDDVLELFRAYQWPGNIREFENAIERAMVLTKHPVLQPEDFNKLGEEETDKFGTGTVDKIVQQIWDGKLKWDHIMNEFAKRSPKRKEIVRGIVDKWIQEKGIRPKHRELASLLETNERNIHQKFRECKLSLTRDWPKEKSR
jgi:two-component system, NtrC family, response regulator AtoC